jgi:hypothetical protein
MDTADEQLPIPPHSDAIQQSSVLFEDCINVIHPQTSWGRRGKSQLILFLLYICVRFAQGLGGGGGGAKLDPGHV